MQKINVVHRTIERMLYTDVSITIPDSMNKYPIYSIKATEEYVEFKPFNKADLIYIKPCIYKADRSIFAAFEVKNA